MTYLCCFVLLPTGFGKSNLLRSTAAFIRPSPRPSRKINSFVHIPTVEQRSLYNTLLYFDLAFTALRPLLKWFPDPSLAYARATTACAYFSREGSGSQTKLYSDHCGVGEV